MTSAGNTWQKHWMLSNFNVWKQMSEDVVQPIHDLLRHCCTLNPNSPIFMDVVTPSLSHYTLIIDSIFKN